MSRYTTDSFTTASVLANGGILDFSRSLPNNFVDIVKIEITPAVVAGTAQFWIHSNSARAAGQVLYNSGIWSGTKFYDPVEDNAGSFAERNEGFVGRYYDALSALSMYCRIQNNDVSNKTYDIKITYALSEFSTNVVGVPDGLKASAYANGLDVTSGVFAAKNAPAIDQAEFRAILVAAGATLPVLEDLRTAGEGGSFAHNGTTQLIITGIVANSEGAQYIWTSAAQGTWYFAWRLHNSFGWSNWSDGNITPMAVTQRVNTNTTYDSGPPSGWSVSVENGPIANTVIVHATRPATNGVNILYWMVQVKDASTGSWRELDANAGAAVTEYDGSGANHQFDPATLTFITPGTWGTASVGDLVLIDVQGAGSWTLANCQWATVKSLNGTAMVIHGRWRPLTSAHKTGPVYDQVRLKIVKPPWNWISEGFLGAQPNGGFFTSGSEGFIPESFVNDLATREFVSDPIPIPAGLTNVEARVWFENGYSRADNANTHSTGYIGGDRILGAYTWNRFDDPNWWIPIIGGDRVSLTINANGTVTVAEAHAGTNNSGIAGVVNRAYIMPGLDGQIQVMSSWTAVTFSDDAGHNYPSQSLMLALWMGNQEPVPGLNSQMLWALSARSVYAAAARKLRLALASWTMVTKNGPVEYALPTPVDIAMPAPGFACDLRVTIQESPAEKFVGWYLLEYQINGAGFNTLTQATMGRPTHIQGVEGYRIMPLVHQQHGIAGDTSTLSAITVTKGIIVGEGPK
jgi:hypothetical protein